VDGTPIEASASLKSLLGKAGSDEPPAAGRNSKRRLKGERRTNDVHRCATDANAKLCRKSSNVGAKLCLMAHALAANRHGPVVEADTTPATRRSEGETALALIERNDPGSARRISLGADQG
jgi:hypothetical protein